MDNIIDFDIGCRKCIHLMRVGKNDFVCNKVVYADGDKIYPILDGKHTADWGACDGDDREVEHRRCSNAGRKDI